MEISEFLKRRIKEMYGSVNRFSQEVGIPQSTLATALNKKDGFQNMAVGTALKICSKLGIDIDQLEEIAFNEEIFEERRLVDIYRYVSKPAKGLIMSHAESVKKYDNEMAAMNEEPEEEEEFNLLAAHGTEGMNEEELEEVYDIARGLKAQFRKKKAEMEND